MTPIKKPYWIILILVTTLAFAQVTDDKKSIEQIDQFLAEKFPTDAPGASVLIVRDGKTLFRKGFGMANVDTKTAVTPESVFRIGSITKQFTSTAILKLAEQGKLATDEEITKFFPDYPTGGKKITIEHLLTHTSGIKSYTSLPAVMTKEAKAKMVAVADMVNVFKSQPMDFSPGDAYLYNNSGYFLLGAIIEKVSGQTWGEYLQKNFFSPLKLRSSFTDDRKIPLMASGYSKNESGYFLADYVHPSVPYSAGAVFSTVDDLWKWNEAIFSYKVVNKESLEKAWTPVELNSGARQSYGYGWQLAKLNNKKVIAHGGGIDGFLSFALYVPDTRLFVTVLTNSTSIPPEDISYRIAAIAMGVSPSDPAVITLEEKKLDQYVGVYQVSEREDRVITREKNRLFSQRTGGAKFEIFPYESDGLFFRDSGSRLKFVRAGNGDIVYVEMSGREFVNQVATKTAKALPAEKKAITLDESTLSQYEGEYELVPGFSITIRKDAARLMAQATGQPAAEIFSESETRFFYKVVEAQIEFNKENDGKISGLTLFQNGKEIRGRKIR